MKNYRKVLKIASNSSVIKKGMFTSLVVGSILNLINQGNLLFTNQLAEFSLIKMSVTYLTPFLVSVYSTTSALLRKDLVLLTKIS